MQPAPRGEPTSDGPEAAPAPRAGRNLPFAIATGLALAGLMFGTLFWRPAAFFVLVMVVLMIAQFELYSVLASRGFRPATGLGLAGGAVILLGAYWRGTQAISFGLVLVVVGTFLWFVIDPDREQVATSVAVTVLGVVYVPLLGAHAVLIRALPDGIALTIAFIGLVAFYDIGAYASGSLFGRHKIAPAISPSKTWEGAAGATLLVLILAAVVGPHLGPLTVGSALLLAAVTAGCAPLGDLAESMLKRDLDTKDMGRLLPGHGGAFDRIDALLFTAPAVYWIMRAVVV